MQSAVENNAFVDKYINSTENYDENQGPPSRSFSDENNGSDRDRESTQSNPFGLSRTARKTMEVMASLEQTYEAENAALINEEDNNYVSNFDETFEKAR